MVVYGILVEIIAGRPPAQPTIYIQAQTVNIHNMFNIGQEHWPALANDIRTNLQYQVSPPIRKIAPGPQYDPQPYVEGAPEARQEAIQRGLI